jgi:hypothetical protein
MMVVEPMVMGFFFLMPDVPAAVALFCRLAAARPDWLAGGSQGAPSSERTQPNWPVIKRNTGKEKSPSYETYKSYEKSWR